MWWATATDPEMEVTARVARYAYDRLTNPLYGVSAGAATVWCLAALEGRLQLMPSSEASAISGSSSSSNNLSQFLLRARFIFRYATSNVVPSLIWGTQPPAELVESSRALRLRLYAQRDYYSSIDRVPPGRSLWIRVLCSLRGAVAGTVLLSNVIGLTTLWQQASNDYAQRIVQGREPPLLLDSKTKRRSILKKPPTNNSIQQQGRTIRLCGERSDVTQLTLKRGGALWPVFEDASKVQDLVQTYGCIRNQRGIVSSLPSRPVYWLVSSGAYSKASSWGGMKIPTSWLYTVGDKKLLYLEADATVGDESAMALHQHDTPAPGEMKRHSGWMSLWNGRGNSVEDEEFPQLDLDLDLKEVAQGFRCLSQLVTSTPDDEDGETNKRSEVEIDASNIEVMRVLLVDPTVIVESGGGRRETAGELAHELALTDILVDARQSILSAKLKWLQQHHNTNCPKINGRRPVILETPSKEWFASIRAELRKYGYEIMDRSQMDMTEHEMPPFLVYERSGADTVHTIQEYIEQGIVQDPSRVCALLTSHEGMDAIVSLNKSLEEEGRAVAVGCICSSSIHDRAFDWVRQKCLQGVPAIEIQKELNEGRAWEA